MNSKILNEAAWKAWSKGRTLNDAPLVKLLATWGKLPEQDADKQLETLAGIFKQAELLRGAHKSDKDVLRQMETLAKEIKQQEQEAKARKAQLDRQSSDTADDDDAPTLLSDKLLSQLKVIKSTEGLKRPMTIGILGSSLAVAVAAKSISPSQRKLMQAQLGVGTVKYFTGECLYENNAHTFMLEKSIAGLAKRIKEAIQNQTGKSFKVRVRGLDPADVDDDEAPAPEQGEGPDLALLFKERLALLSPDIKNAMDAGGKIAEALKLKTSEASTLARRQDFKAAQAVLDQVASLLSMASKQPKPQAVPDAPAAHAAHAAHAAVVPPKTKSSSTDLQAIKTRLGALLPKLQEATAPAAPKNDRSQQLKLLQSEIATLLRRNELAEADALINQLADLLDQPTAPQDSPSNNIAQLDRRLLTDAQQAYADYLQAQTTSSDLAYMDAQLSRAETLAKTWQAEVGEQGSPDHQGQMSVLVGKMALEREALNEVKEHTADMDALLAQLAESSDPDEQAALHQLLQELMQSFPS